MNQYKSFFEAVQRPENYVRVIIEDLQRRQNTIQQIAKKNNILNLALWLSTYLRKYKIIIRVDEEIGDYFGFSKEAETLPDKYNTIRMYINSKALLIAKEDTEHLFDRFLMGFSNILGHEIIHRLQFHNKVNVDLQKYLMSSKTDAEYWYKKQEMMAYAWTIIEEFRFMKLSDEQILNIIKNVEIKKSHILTLHVPQLYKYYLILFIDDTEARNRLHKYIYEYLVS